jgi:hypothetical protein
VAICISYDEWTQLYLSWSGERSPSLFGRLIPGGKDLSVPTRQEVRWAPESVWTNLVQIFQKTGLCLFFSSIKCTGKSRKLGLGWARAELILFFHRTLGENDKSVERGEKRKKVHKEFISLCATS